MKIKWPVFLVLLFLSLVAVKGHASDSGVVVRACQVMKEPFKDAQVIISLQEGETVEILKRKGGWLQVSRKGKTGWVRLLNVRRGESSGKVSAVAEASGVLDLATGRAGGGNVVAATGIRGLDEEGLKEAKFNGEELEKMKTYRATGQEARQFAGQAGLLAQQVPFIQPADRN